MYIELQTKTNFSFLRGASHGEELCERAAELGYPMLGITDCHSLAGIVRAHVAAKKYGIRLLVGVSVQLRDLSRWEGAATGDADRASKSGERNAEEASAVPPPIPITLLLYPHSREAYGRLSTLLTRGKLRAPKAECFLGIDDVREYSAGMDCLIVLENEPAEQERELLQSLKEAFPDRCSLVVHRLFLPGEARKQKRILGWARALSIPLVATNDVAYHIPRRRILQDVLTCVRLGCRIDEAGYALNENAERHLKPPAEMKRLFRRWPGAVRRSAEIAERASRFSLDELRYEYPSEICPEGKTPAQYLRELTCAGAEERYPEGVPPAVQELIEHELRLIGDLRYEKYFLTVYDIVKFARSRGILCQGRGAAANSAVCYVLGITAVDPSKIRLLMERFISKERNEPPDIDIDFEHERREEVIQYLYEKYGRLRAALVAEVICYRSKSSFRDVGKVFGLSPLEIENLIKVYTRFRDRTVTDEHLREMGLSLDAKTVRATISLSRKLRSFPRHLSQHVGGFVISDIPLCEIVPIENAAMEDRTVLEWDKDDIDAMGMLKIDVLALGMLTAIRKGIEYINALGGPRPALASARSATSPFPAAPADLAQLEHLAQLGPLPRPAHPPELELHTVPKEVSAVYDMICKADTIGVFQIESRAQMSMLPRLRPRCYYDLVVEVAIVRPGPIQGGMVHPFLRRRMGLEPVTYPDDRVRSVLEATLGVPIFQEQVMELSIVAAGFTPGEADELRRAMASWRRNKNLMARFQTRIYDGMLGNGYTAEFAERLFDQIRGFGEYGFPQSHSASFALLVYVSSWMKYFYPGCFAAALINSQPMGFYQPAQIIQDAKNHGIEVLPVDVNCSEWDCTMESLSPREAPDWRSPDGGPKDTPWKLRLGMRLVRGMSEAEAQKIIEARKTAPFRSILDLWRRSGAKVSQIRQLARADAFRSIGRNRQQAIWEAGKLKDERLPLFDGLDQEAEWDGDFLPQLGGRLQVWRDYASVGLTLRKHPLSYARRELTERRVQTIAEFKEQSIRRPGSWATIAGLVIMRQRPGTANGTIFMTIEDETGMGSIIIRRGIQERFESAIMDGMFVIVRGRTQHQHGVVHLLLEEISDFTGRGGGLHAESRDFH